MNIIKNIYDFGYDINLNKVGNTYPELGLLLDSPDSPVVYNSVEDRLSQMTQSGGTVTNSITGLPLSTIDPTQGYTGGSAF